MKCMPGCPVHLSTPDCWKSSWQGELSIHPSFHQYNTGKQLFYWIYKQFIAYTLWTLNWIKNCKLYKQLQITSLLKAYLHTFTAAGTRPDKYWYKVCNGSLAWIPLAKATITCIWLRLSIFDDKKRAWPHNRHFTAHAIKKGFFNSGHNDIQSNINKKKVLLQL